MTDPLLLRICENSQAAQMPTAHCLMHHPFKVVNVVTRNGFRDWRWCSQSGVHNPACSFFCNSHAILLTV